MKKMCLTSGTIISPFGASGEYTWAKIMSNFDVHSLLQWINENIVDGLFANEGYYTIQVKLRIATGMLNKITSLSDAQKQTLHERLTTNVNDLYFIRETRDLPF